MSISMVLEPKLYDEKMNHSLEDTLIVPIALSMTPLHFCISNGGTGSYHYVDLFVKERSCQCQIKEKKHRTILAIITPNHLRSHELNHFLSGPDVNLYYVSCTGACHTLYHEN